MSEKSICLSILGVLFFVLTRAQSDVYPAKCLEMPVSGHEYSFVTTSFDGFCIVKMSKDSLLFAFFSKEEVSLFGKEIITNFDSLYLSRPRYLFLSSDLAECLNFSLFGCLDILQGGKGTFFSNLSPVEAYLSPFELNFSFDVMAVSAMVQIGNIKMEDRVFCFNGLSVEEVVFLPHIFSVERSVDSVANTLGLILNSKE